MFEERAMSSEITGGSESSLPPLPPATTQEAAPARPVKSPGVALVLSLFPGLGQVYNGQPTKAFVFFFAWLGSIYFTAKGEPLPFAFLIPFVYFYNLVDAYRTAAALGSRGAAAQAEAEAESAESPAWGITLAGVGLLLLLNNLGFLRLAAFNRYWPVLLIVAGAASLVVSLRRRRERPAVVEDGGDRF
jgi:hypothetical protein